MSTIQQETFLQIVNLLIPHCSDPASRKALATTALFGCSVLDKLDYAGNARDYVVHLVTTLLTYGECEANKPAIVALLEQVQEEVGVSQKKQIADLIGEIPGGVIEVSAADWQVSEQPSSAPVFISYSRGDLENVRRITSDLLNAGVNVWIDQKGLKAGTGDWEQALRDAIEGASAVLYMASPTARRSAYVRDELAIAQAKNKMIYPVWVAGEERTDCIPMGLGYVQLVDMRQEGYEAGLKQLLEGLSTQSGEGEKPEAVQVTTEAMVELSDPRNPYKGLRSFRAEDEADFFGRESLIEDLIKMLGNGIEAPRLLGVLGASGSGKSSVVMAGLLPRLKQGAIEGSENWHYLDPIVPGNHPIENLTIALRREMKDTAPKHIREELQDANKRGLHALTCELSDKPIILYIDQFEELFTLVDDEAERRQFIDLLTTAISESSGVLIIILSMRADFYDRPMQYPEFGKLLEAHHVAVTPMTLADLYDVVQQPAQLPDVQLSFEEGLATELVYAVREEVVALPLLQFTLDQLFEKQTERTLTLEAYKTMGGVQGALAQHAEATFNNLPSEQHKTLARALFLRLIEAGATEQDTTRRRASVSELTLPDAEQTRILQETANAFVDARLLVSDSPRLVGEGQGGEGRDERTIEVSHEALIREWQYLGDWLRDARDDIRLQKSLAADVTEWKRREQPDDMLYRGTVLTDAQAWSERNAASRDETMFLHESEKAESERRKRDEAIARRVQLFQRASVLLGVMVVLAVVTIGLAVVTANNAQAQRDIAYSVGTEAAGEATVFAAQQNRVATLAAGNAVINVNEVVQTPEAFFATETAIADLLEWTPEIQEFDGVEMVLVPVGCFWMGSVISDDEQAIHEMCIDEPYWIDRYEVTNAQFETFEGVAADDAGWADPQQPRTLVTWFEARDFCADKRGARLPTEAEWEYAARGPNSSVYPWGNDFGGDNVVYSSRQPEIVGSREDGESWVDAYDMSGNVWEWVNTIYEPYPYATDDGREEDSNRTDVRRVLRGGSYLAFANPLRSAYRNWSSPAFVFHDSGFRCVRS